jgi:prepilin-type processing-associated H-X9-DG protein
VPIHFTCPHCGAATQVDEQYAGLTGPCVQCGKAVAIPISGGVVQAPSRGANTVVIIAVVAVLGVVLLGGAVLAALLIPTIIAGREAARRAQCVHNLTQIASAMRSYEVANGCFPPAYIADKYGKPMHSWRVLLLPYLGQQDLYDRYRFEEPWNSDNNRAITDLSIGLFQCPAQPATKEPTTNYMMVVGPHTISDGPESRKIAEITDGLAHTILVVEVADSAVWWTEPEDLHFDQMTFRINGGKRQEISSYHPQGANVAFCDGSVRLLNNSMNPQLVKAMTTIDGGETPPSER